MTNRFPWWKVRIGRASYVTLVRTHHVYRAEEGRAIYCESRWGVLRCYPTWRHWRSPGGIGAPLTWTPRGLVYA